ncbi:hypothetical protein [Streptomyces sp. MMBL 11-3]|uniref:hypothetical protein n=1 Tax=Streptomyces sp. MMBL 11-3 TaxID=3382639 RepID=UPI0039B5D4E9
MASTTSPRWATGPVDLGALLRTARIGAGLFRARLADLLHASSGQLQGVEQEGI